MSGIELLAKGHYARAGHRGLNAAGGNQSYPPDAIPVLLLALMDRSRVPQLEDG